MSAFLSPSKSNSVEAVGGLLTVTVNILWNVRPQLSVAVTVMVNGPPTGPLLVIVTTPVVAFTPIVPVKPPPPDAVTIETEPLSPGAASGVRISLHPVTTVELA